MKEKWSIAPPALMCRVKLAILLYLLLQSPHLWTHPSEQTVSYLTNWHKAVSQNRMQIFFSCLMCEQHIFIWRLWWLDLFCTLVYFEFRWCLSKCTFLLGTHAKTILCLIETLKNWTQSCEPWFMRIFARVSIFFFSCWTLLSFIKFPV